MGKSLKGKELGVGISQRQDGLYTARFTTRGGKRKQAYFKKLQECRQWLADMEFKDEHGDVLKTDSPTVDAWFNYWLDNIKGDNIRYNTRLLYLENYKNDIKPYIGDMLINQIRPLHCQNVLNIAAAKLSQGTVNSIRNIMGMFFDSAAENKLIRQTPISKNVKAKANKVMGSRNAMTRASQKILLEAIRDTKYYNIFAFVLQTGLRTGEVLGLKWTDIDWDSRIVHINRNAVYNTCDKEWYFGSTKTASGIRSIPLTNEAIMILKNQREKNIEQKFITLKNAEFVFCNDNGVLPYGSLLNVYLSNYCNKLNIPHVSMHILRHTFATRCIEAGMRPKTLQTILGHSNINITMNLYVHTTDDEKQKEVENVEQMLKLV